MALCADGLFSLKWGEFQPFISNSIKSLRDLGDFTDVTLVCEDGQQEAHRIILSACSPFFQRVLKLQSGQQQLVMFMRGVEIGQLTSLLDFIYTGEVELPRDDVDQFILLAGELKIKGLVLDKQTNDESAEAKNASIKETNASKEDAKDEPSKTKQLKMNELAKGKPSKVLASLENKVDEEGISLDESTIGYLGSETIAFEGKVRVKKEKLQFRKEFVAADNVSELEEKIESMMERGEKGFVCKACEKYAGTRQHVIYHIEANHVEGLKHLCTECHRSFKVRHSLQSHMNRKHKKGANITGLTTSQDILNPLKEEMKLDLANRPARFVLGDAKKC